MTPGDLYFLSAMGIAFLCVAYLCWQCIALARSVDRLEREVRWYKAWDEARPPLSETPVYRLTHHGILGSTEISHGPEYIYEVKETPEP